MLSEAELKFLHVENTKNRDKITGQFPARIIKFIRFLDRFALLCIFESRFLNLADFEEDLLWGIDYHLYFFLFH